MKTERDIKNKLEATNKVLEFLPQTAENVDKHKQLSNVKNTLEWVLKCKECFEYPCICNDPY